MTAGSQFEKDLLYARIARMGKEEVARLLSDLQTFPCDALTKDFIIAFIRDDAPTVTPQEYLERMIASGRSSGVQRYMKDWAKSEPNAALQWYEEMRGSLKLYPGLSNKLHNAIASDLIVGLGLSDPEQALALYERTPRNEMKEYTVRWLSASCTEGMIRSGDDTHLLRLIDAHSSQDRKDILTASFQKFGEMRKFEEGLAFIDQHNGDPGDQLDYIGKMITWMPLQEGSVESAMDWALLITPEAEAPKAVRRFAAIAASERVVTEMDVGEWLEAQTLGLVRDSGYFGLVEGNLDGYLPRANQAAEKIDDATLQAAALQAIAEEIVRREESKNR